ncbi:hypothetical protein JW865_04355 [Candidatus Bathyarchaeota archaeon]|nr:hypothetical protein [Candidatus Bathyarchaeota archaeon]
MSSLSIEARQMDSGFEINLRGSRYVVKYPNGFWKNYPQEAKDVLFDNLVYAETIHLPLTLRKKEIRYNTSAPYFQTHFFQNMIMDLPSCADVDGTSTSELIKEYMNLKVKFKDYDVKIPSYKQPSRDDSSVVALSFGKDSLLTWAVCKEIGLNPQITYIVEPLLLYEEKHKDILAKDFEKEFKVKLNKIIHTTGHLRDGVRLGVGKTEIGWGLQNTQYAMMILPIAQTFEAKYILFGNEQSCAEYYYDREGYICYPAYDQSHKWTINIDLITRSLTNNNVRTISVIEPLNDIAVVYALYKRYPEVAKYHMSCFVETEAGRDTRWCMNCSVCSKMYLLIRACGFDPASVGINRNMLTEDCRDYFSLFGGSNINTYALTGRGRDEQLFAFYLAWKNGDRSSLVEEFAQRFLEEAKGREDELYKTFFNLHESITMPKEINNQVISIYKEVLSNVP